MASQDIPVRLREIHESARRHCTADDLENHFSDIRLMIVNAPKRPYSIKEKKISNTILNFIKTHYLINDRDKTKISKWELIKKSYNSAYSFLIHQYPRILKIDSNLMFIGSQYPVYQSCAREPVEKKCIVTGESIKDHEKGLTLYFSRRQKQIFENAEQLLQFINSLLDKAKVHKNVLPDIKHGSFKGYSLEFSINKGEKLDVYKMLSCDNRLIQLFKVNKLWNELKTLDNWVRAKVQDNFSNNRKPGSIFWFPCNNPKCPKKEDGILVMTGPTLDKIQLKCDGCKTEICSSCHKEYHGYTDCQAEPEEQAKQSAINHTKPCPKCNLRIEKSISCNHMTCISCNCDWCWCCGEELDFRINSGGHPRGHYCYSHQFREVKFLGGIYETCPGKNCGQSAQQELEDDWSTDEELIPDNFF